MMRKLFIRGPDSGGDGVYYLLTEDGYHLASHYCSSISFAKSDLIERRQERKEQRKEYLRDGYELIIANREDKERLLSLNQKFDTEEKMDKYLEENGLVLKVTATTEST